MREHDGARSATALSAADFRSGYANFVQIVAQRKRRIRVGDLHLLPIQPEHELTEYESSTNVPL